MRSTSSRRLHEAAIPTVVIAGNHSTPRVAATDHIFGLLKRFGCVHAVCERARGHPHRRARGARRSRTATTPSRCAHGCARRDRGRTLASTCSSRIGLPGLGHVGAEAGSIELSGEALEAVGDFNYIALGHLHQFDRVARNAVYAGSLERLTWADRAKKCIIEVDLTADPGMTRRPARRSTPAVSPASQAARR